MNMRHPGSPRTVNPRCRQGLLRATVMPPCSFAFLPQCGSFDLGSGMCRVRGSGRMKAERRPAREGAADKAYDP